jgi:transposase-like protein
MADESMVALREALGKLLESEHADLLRESVALVVREVMELEACERAGAERYERSAERSTYRNGYRQREWDTRVGTIELAIPRLRQGSYLPSFLNARKRSEQALLAVVMEAYTNGVSTRKVERLVEQLGVESMSKSQVSRICAALDERVEVSVAVRWRAPIGTSGWTPGSSVCAKQRPAWCARKRCWWPMRCTKRAAAR